MRRFDWAKEWRQFRKKHGYTQQVLAGILGISRRTVQNTEAGTHRPHSSTRDAYNLLKDKYRKEDDARNSATHTAAA